MNTDLDALVAHCGEQQTGFAGLTRGKPVDVWAWRHSCMDAYAEPQIRYKLICFCVFSQRAMPHLFARRLALAEQLRPAEFVDVSACNTWPPVLEADLSGLADAEVIHPVLDQPRYVASKIGLLGYLNPASLFHRKLRRLPVTLYVPTLASTVARRAQRTFRNQRLARH